MNSRLLRIAVLGAAALAFLALVGLRWGEVEQMTRVVREADWRWLPLALLTESLFQTNEAAIYWVMYRVMGYRTDLRDVVRFTLAASFVNRVAPSGGVSGTTFFAERMRRKGIPSAATVSVYLSRFLLDYGAFVIVITAGLFYLSTHHDLTRLEVKAALTFGGILVVGIAAAVGMFARRDLLTRFLAWTFRIGNRVSRRLVHRDLVTKTDVAHDVDELFTALGILGRSGGKTLGLAGMGFLIHILDLSGLFIVFHAVRWPVHLGVLVTGYGLAYLAGIVSLLPSGIGAFEASMTLVYVSLGVPIETAVLVTVVYRLFSLWLPMLAGFVSFQFSIGKGEASAR